MAAAAARGCAVHSMTPAAIGTAVATNYFIEMNIKNVENMRARGMNKIEKK